MSLLGIILIIVVSVILYHFFRDWNSVKAQTKSAGGINAIFPNFIKYINSLNAIVKNEIDKGNVEPHLHECGNWSIVDSSVHGITFKSKWALESSYIGNLYLKLTHDFATILHLEFVDWSGNIRLSHKIKFDNTGVDIPVNEYESYLEELLARIMSSEKFQQFLDNEGLWFEKTSIQILLKRRREREKEKER